MDVDERERQEQRECARVLVHGVHVRPIRADTRANRARAQLARPERASTPLHEQTPANRRTAHRATQDVRDAPTLTRGMGPRTFNASTSILTSFKHWALGTGHWARLAPTAPAYAAFQQRRRSHHARRPQALNPTVCHFRAVVQSGSFACGAMRYATATASRERDGALLSEPSISPRVSLEFPR